MSREFEHKGLIDIPVRADGTREPTHIVDISDAKVSDRREDVLVTYSLGSCIGLTLYDPVAGVGGLLHCMLPLSRLDEDKAKKNPYMFADTGAAKFLQGVYDKGGKSSRLIAKIAGAAKVLGGKELFKIGKRNYTVLRKILWKNNILIDAEDTGGTALRTLYLYMDTGRTFIKSQGRVREL